MRRAFLAMVAAAAAPLALVDGFQFRPPIAAAPGRSISSPIATSKQQPWAPDPQRQTRPSLAVRFAAPPPDGGFEGAVQQPEPEEEAQAPAEGEGGVLMSSAASGAAALEESKRSLGDLFQLWKRRLWCVPGTMLGQSI